jgi:hypothetical protein
LPNPDASNEIPSEHNLGSDFSDVKLAAQCGLRELDRRRINDKEWHAGHVGSRWPKENKTEKSQKYWTMSWPRVTGEKTIVDIQPHEQRISQTVSVKRGKFSIREIRSWLGTSRAWIRQEKLAPHHQLRVDNCLCFGCETGMVEMAWCVRRASAQAGDMDWPDRPERICHPFTPVKAISPKPGS